MGFRRCTVRGRLVGDVWQFGFVLQSDEQLSIMADALGDAIDAYMTARSADYPDDILWDDVVCSELETGTGRVTDVAASPLTVSGTGVQTPLPMQCTACVSILPITGTSTGRFYLPPFGTSQLDANGSLSSTIRTNHTASLKTLFDTMSARSSPARLGIWKTTTNSFVGAARISMGSVVDTQRRRRNKRVETRTSVALAI